jgi:drug/metabolite transporter (DMT)-like permease
MVSSRMHSAAEVRAALLVTSLGGLLFTLDLPLLRLSMADHWTMVFTRGLFLFTAIAGTWAVMRLAGREKAPFLAGGAGLAVALASTLGNMCYIGAVVHTDAANVVFIIALTPVIAAGMSHVLLREKVHPFTWAATAGAFLGAALIASEGLRTGNWFGDCLALASAVCSAAIFTIIRATGRKVATSLAVGSLASAMVAVIVFGVSADALAAPGAFRGSSLGLAGAQRSHRHSACDRAAGAGPTRASIGRRQHVFHARNGADAGLDMAAVRGDSGRTRIAGRRGGGHDAAGPQLVAVHLFPQGQSDSRMKRHAKLS